MTDETIFATALEKANPAERAAFLAEACGHDPECRKRLEGLLLAHARAANFLESPPVAAHDSDQDATQALTGTPVPGAAAAQTTGGANGASDDEPLTFLAPPTRPDALGRLGHYEVLQVLGRGGFGIVFRAFDEILQRVVALKVMAPQLAATSPARKRFLREARSSAQVRHENVVQVYEIAEQPLPYLAMEFIPGETLQQKLDRVGPLDVPETLRIGRQIAEGLAAAHATDLIHRDIKPGNVLLEGGQHKVKITDFGLARAADDASISQSGIIAGTPMYMAPEQAQGQTLDQRADLFSLGSVLYQMVAGRPPFRANSAIAVLKRVAEDKPRAIREIIPETPQWLCDIIAKLHAKDPDERYQSAREVADVLADCEAQLKANAKLKDYSRIPRSQPQRSGRRKWVAVTAAVLLSVFALVVTELAGVTHLFRGQQAKTDPDRKAAEYVLSVGGTVQVNDQDRTINSADELPSEPFRLMWVGLKNNRNLSDAGLASFKGCKNLTFLGLFGTNISDTGLANFQECKKLIFLNLSHTKIGDAGLANFAECRDLSTIGLTGTNVTDAGLAYLKNYRNPTWVFLDKTKVTAAGVDNLQKRFPNSKIEWDGSATRPGAQEAAAKQLGVPVETTNSIGMKLRLIPPGKFTMGSSKEEIGFWLKQKQDGWYKELLLSEGPQHEVEITQPFYMGQTDVTVGQFRQFVKATGYKTQAEREGGAERGFPNGDFKDVANTDWLNPGFTQIDDHPVVCVSWNDAVEFCRWLSKQEGKTYRLPTEAEWEYSCRAGSKSRWSFGDNEGELWDYARVGGNSQHHSWPVAGLKENAWGLYDMHGNVWQWCQDLFDPDYYKTSPPKDPPGPAADDERVIRGGSWLWHDAWWSRSAMRNKVNPARRANFAGFRVVLCVSSPQTKTSPLAVAPFTDADVQRIAALPAAEQVAEVRKELMRRNPGFDGKVEHKIEDGVVTEFRIVTDKVTDIAPIRVWSALRVLNCSGTWANFKPNGLLEDLTPLKGMKLAFLTHLHLGNTKVGDAGMVYFKDCKKLTQVYLNNTQVSDAGLANFRDCQNLKALDLTLTQATDAGMVYFKDCKDLSYFHLINTKVTNAGLANFKDCKDLTSLGLGGTQVGDAGLTHLKGMPLRSLSIDQTAVTDLTPLQSMALEEIHLTPKNITRGLDILRDMNSLKTIGIHWYQSWPAAEFWERYDKGEFK